MKPRSLGLGLALFVALGCNGPTVTRAPQSDSRITNLVAKGNLQSLRPVDCIELGAVSDRNTPADLMAGFRKCVDQGKFETAARLFGAAGAFGYFDTQRVSDTTAHQAVAVLSMQAIAELDEPTRAGLKEAMELAFVDAEQLASMCDEMRRIGYPKYHPTYMIQHGMGAFLGGKGNGLIQGFNSKRAWELSLETYLHCE